MIDPNPVETTIRRIGGIVLIGVILWGYLDRAFGDGHRTMVPVEGIMEIDSETGRVVLDVAPVDPTEPPPIEPPPIEPPEPPPISAPASEVRDAPPWLLAMIDELPAGKFFRLPSEHKLASYDVRPDMRWCEPVYGDPGNRVCEDHAAWSQTGIRAVMSAWGGVGAMRSYGEAGALGAMGGGHASYAGSSVFIYDLETLRWTNTNPYGFLTTVGGPYDESPIGHTASWLCTFADGSPVPGHFLFTNVGIPGTEANPNGMFVSAQCEEGTNLELDTENFPRLKGRFLRAQLLSLDGPDGEPLTYETYEHTATSSPWMNTLPAHPGCAAADTDACPRIDYPAAAWYSRPRIESEHGQKLVVMEDPVYGVGLNASFAYLLDPYAPADDEGFVGDWTMWGAVPYHNWLYRQLACPLGETVEQDLCVMSNFNSGRSWFALMNPSDPDAGYVQTTETTPESELPGDFGKHASLDPGYARGQGVIYYYAPAGLDKAWYVTFRGDKAHWELVVDGAVDDLETNIPEQPEGMRTTGLRTLWYRFDEQKEHCIAEEGGGSVCEFVITVPNTGSLKERYRPECPAQDPDACGYAYAALIPTTTAPEPPEPPDPGGDFRAECEARDAIICHEFRSQADVDEVYLQRYAMHPAVYDPEHNAARMTIPSTAEWEAAQPKVSAADIAATIQYYGAQDGGYGPTHSTTGELLFQWPVVSNATLHMQYEILLPQEMIDIALYGKYSILWHERSCGSQEEVIQPYAAMSDGPHGGMYGNCGWAGYHWANPYPGNVGQIDGQPGGDTECMRHPEPQRTRPCGNWEPRWTKLRSETDLWASREGGATRLYMTIQNEDGTWGDERLIIDFPPPSCDLENPPDPCTDWSTIEGNLRSIRNASALTLFHYHGSFREPVERMNIWFRNVMVSMEKRR